LHRGTVVAFGYEFIDQRDATAYTDLLIVGDDDITFSTHGDSGSLIVSDDGQLNPIGLLWGGWQKKLRSGHAQENWTYGIALSRVLEVKCHERDFIQWQDPFGYNTMALFTMFTLLANSSIIIDFIEGSLLPGAVL